MEVTPHTITLSGGYTDKQDHVHRDVTFGRRVLGNHLFALDSDKQAAISTQYVSLAMRPAITKFGDLSLPVPLDALLSLALPDREDLIKAYNHFELETSGERKSEFISDSVVHLAFGFTLENVTYDVVEFGRQCTGYDEVDADKEKLEGLSRECFLIGREITRLSQHEGQATLDGPVGLNFFKEVDANSITDLRIASQIWRNSFRRTREAVQGDAGNASAGAGARAEVERGTDSAATESAS